MSRAKQKVWMILGDLSLVLHRGIDAGGGVGFALICCYVGLLFAELTDPWLAPGMALPRDQEILFLGSVTLLLIGYLFITGLVLGRKESHRQIGRAY